MAKTFENPIFLILFILGVTILGIVIDQWKSRQWGQKKSPSQGARPIEATSMTGNDSKLRYSKCKLMTEHEKACYDRLKPVTDKLQLEIFTKVRLLDLFEPNEDRIDSKTLFYKVSQKHIDFVIWDSKHNSVVLLLEISDYSHSAPDRRYRDGFVRSIAEEVGYNFAMYPEIKPDLMEVKLKGLLRGNLS